MKLLHALGSLELAKALEQLGYRIKHRPALLADLAQRHGMVCQRCLLRLLAP